MNSGGVRTDTVSELGKTFAGQLLLWTELSATPTAQGEIRSRELLPIDHNIRPVP